jgi:hypothetical protein
MNNKTAVDWLIDAIRSNLQGGKLNAIALSELKIKAKEMEKQQIHNAFDSGVCHALEPKGNPLAYYYQTYK